MSKYIGIDYGQKRIGLSVTDDDKVFAFPLKTVKKIDFFDFSACMQNPIFTKFHVSLNL